MGAQASAELPHGGAAAQHCTVQLPIPGSAPPTCPMPPACPRVGIIDRVVWPMHHFPDDLVAQLFAVIARRGNPCFAVASDATLFARGYEMAQHAKWHPCSVILTIGGQPCGLAFAWDTAHEPHFYPHPELAGHAELHRRVDAQLREVLGAQLDTPGEVLQHSLAGLLPHVPGARMNDMWDNIQRARWWMGYRLFLGVAVHERTIDKTIREKLKGQVTWVHHFSDVVLPDGRRPLLGLHPHRAVSTMTPVTREEW
eukprot:TRINITY_DN9096_c0_g1_i1.p1 TRINITY_DN9096_c0_g1~~TRINITY_DN9096_c0_g1_i1.p1  ORF type:complete len:255 (+),score=43.39 TRINITY_DN9096_c0_g1_i1:128-892(+)